MNTLPVLLPIVRVWDNPLCVAGEEPEEIYSYQPKLGLCMRDLIPAECGRAVLVVNGEPLLQRHWYRLVLQGDVIEWHVLPNGGGNGSRAILQIIAVIAIAYFTGGLGVAAGGTWSTLQVAALQIGLNVAASLLINALIPIQGATSSPGANAASVYNIALAANQSRLNQPIPVGYGRMRLFPDFACLPYGYFESNDQFFNAVYCIGQGEYNFEALNIDDAPIGSFQSLFYKILPPGTAPTRVNPLIVTANTVSGNTLEAGKPIGGFPVCGFGKTVTQISWDVTCDQGLGVSDSGGNFSPLSLNFDVDIHYIDDFNTELEPWQNLAHSTVTAASRTPQRFTFTKVLPHPGRVEVRLTRTTPQNLNNLVVNVLNWAGLRGQLDTTASLCPTATHLEVVIKANEQLNAATQKRLNVIVRRLLRKFDISGGGWTPPTETRSIAWAIADVWTNPDYGNNQPVSSADMQSLHDLDLIWEARQDHFDYYFNQALTSKAAADLIAQCGRAVTFQRMGLFTLTRDQYSPLPLASFTTRDIVPGSTAITYASVTPETADAISYEYFDHRLWDWAPILCKVPGVTDPQNIVTLRVNGITGHMQALREGTYLAAVNLYRRKFPKWQTEMKGLLPAYGSPVIFAPALPGWGQPGDVVLWNKDTLVARLSEPAVFVVGKNHFITLEQPNGSLTIAIPVTPGAIPNEVVLGLSPGFKIITDDSDRERTKYIFGPEGQHRTIVRLLNVAGKGSSAAGNPVIELSGVAENNLVHSADNAYLPAGGVIQDAVPNVLLGIVSPSELLRISLHSHSEETGTLAYGSDYTSAGGAISFNFFKDGTVTCSLFSSHTVYVSYTPTTHSYVGEWINGVIEPGYSSNYEINVAAADTVVGVQYANADSSPTTFDTWLNLGAADYQFVLEVDSTNTPNTYGFPGITGTFLARIRRVGTTVNLAVARLDMRIAFSESEFISGGT